MKPSAAVISRKRRFGTAKCVEDKLCEINAHIDVLCQYVEGETYVGIDPSCFDILTRMTEFASSYRIVKRTHREDFPRDVWGIIAQYTSPQMICTMRLVSRRLNELFSPYVRALGTPVINNESLSVLKTLLQRFTGVRVWAVNAKRILDKETFKAIYVQGRPGLRFVLKSSPSYICTNESTLNGEMFDIQGADWDVGSSYSSMYPAKITGIRCLFSLNAFSQYIQFALHAVLPFDCCVNALWHNYLAGIASLYILMPPTKSRFWDLVSCSAVRFPSYLTVYLDERMSLKYHEDEIIRNCFIDVAGLYLWDGAVPAFAQ